MGGKLNKYYTKIMLPELAKTARAMGRRLESQRNTYLGIAHRMDYSVMKFADGTIKRLRQLDAYHNFVEKTEYTTEKTARGLVKGMAEGAEALPSAFGGKGVPAGDGIMAGKDSDEDIAGGPAVP